MVMTESRRLVAQWMGAILRSRCFGSVGHVSRPRIPTTANIWPISSTRCRPYGMWATYVLDMNEWSRKAVDKTLGRQPIADFNLLVERERSPRSAQR